MTNDPVAIINTVKYAVAALVAVYFLLAIGLTMLAGRLRLSVPWMALAWVPGLNFFLLCRLARASYGLVVPLLIPFVNLFTLGYLGARIAQRLGRSGAIGALFGVPVLGVFIPIPLALAGQTPPPDESRGESRNPSLGLGMVGAVLGLMLLVVGSAMAMGFLTQRPVLSAEQSANALPKHLAGTLIEFPIDTDKAQPATPGNLLTQRFGPLEKGRSAYVKVVQGQLPPWVTPESLAVSAESLALAEYRIHPNDTPVMVVTLALRDGETPALNTPSKQELAKIAPDAAATGIEVKSVAGTTYRGYRARSSDSAFYALRRQDGKVGILISANRGADLAVAERLAMSVGNGKGILEQQQYAGAFGDIPPAPAGMEVGEVMTFTAADLNRMVQTFGKEPSSEQKMQGAAIAELIKQAQPVLPQSLSVTTYSGTKPEGNAPVFSAVAAYPNSTSAWLAMKTFGFLSTNSTSLLDSVVNKQELKSLPKVESIKVGDAKALTGTMEGVTVVLLQRGGAITAFAGDPKAVSAKAWAEAYLSGVGRK